jgi:hypothetical protein
LYLAPHLGSPFGQALAHIERWEIRARLDVLDGHAGNIEPGSGLDPFFKKRKWL